MRLPRGQHNICIHNLGGGEVKKILLFVVVLSLLAGITQAEDTMTKADLIRKARLGTGLEPSDSIATNAVQCAMDFIQTAAIYPVCVDTIRIDLAASQELYALPADCYRPLAVYIDPTGRALDWNSFWDKQKVPDATTISTERMDKVWSFQDDSVKFVGFDPVPSAVDSAILIYEANVTEIIFGSGGSAQRVRVRECYHPALVAAVKSFLFERYERYDKSEFYLKKAETFINAAERKLSVPPVDLLMSPRTYTRP